MRPIHPDADSGSGQLRFSSAGGELLTASPDDAMVMLLSSETPAMEAYRVSRAVNTPRNNVEQLLQPVVA